MDRIEELNVKKICGCFEVEGSFVRCVQCGEGHINDTYKVTIDNHGKLRHYLLQRLNKMLSSEVEKLMHNIELVTSYCRKNIEANGGDPMRECLNPIRARDGKCYIYDGESCFRMFDYIEGAKTYQNADDPNVFYESAVTFGNFARMLSGFDASQLYEVLPDFHNTKVRYSNFLAAVQKDICGRAKGVQAEITWVNSHKYLCGKIVDRITSGEIPLRVTHNDTKLNNVMFDQKTGKGLVVVDLDTVMPGSVCYDFGDSIRFGCNSAAEDEPDIEKVHFMFDRYKIYLKGYFLALGDTLVAAEKENLPMGAILMTYECGMRFLTDYLEGDVYYHTSRARQNLERARTQFKLVNEMIAVYDKMLAAVKEIA